MPSSWTRHHKRQAHISISCQCQCSPTPAWSELCDSYWKTRQEKSLCHKTELIIINQVSRLFRLKGLDVNNKLCNSKMKISYIYIAKNKDIFILKSPGLPLHWTLHFAKCFCDIFFFALWFFFLRPMTPYHAVSKIHPSQKVLILICVCVWKQAPWWKGKGDHRSQLEHH